jgi:hypothetical protein
MLARSPKNRAPDEELAADIQNQLSAAKQQLSEALRKQADAAEASITNGQRAEYDRAVAVVTTARGEIDRLEKALASVEAKVAELARQRRLTEQSGVRQRVGKILDLRLDAAKAFTEHLTLLVRDFQHLCELSNKAYVAFPRDGSEPPEGIALGNMELCSLVAGELFRLGNVPVITGREGVGGKTPSLPAPKSPNLDRHDQIKPLADVIEQANRFAHSLMEGKNDR